MKDLHDGLILNLYRLENLTSRIRKQCEIITKERERSLTGENTRTMTLPTDSQERKNYPLFDGLLCYFPAALAGIARTSKLGNDKHNPGEPLHHARGKSMDHGDCILRHLVDIKDLLASRSRGATISNEAILDEVSQMAWRALAFAQKIHEDLGAPMAPAAKIGKSP